MSNALKTRKSFKVSEVKAFESEMFGTLRVVIIDDEPMFFGVDAARALEYKDLDQAIRVNCEEAELYAVEFDPVSRKDSKNPLVSTKTRFVKLIPESDLYLLIFRSNKPEAKAFRRWVTKEVLPAIRKHGVYMTDDVLEMTLNNPDYMIKLLQKYKEERDKRRKAEETIAILSHVKKLYTTTEIAKELGLRSAKQLNKILADNKIQYNQNGTWVLYSEYADLGYTHIKQEVLDNGKVIYHRKWTQRGREFILNLFNNNPKFLKASEES